MNKAVILIFVFLTAVGIRAEWLTHAQLLDLSSETSGLRYKVKNLEIEVGILIEEMNRLRRQR